MSASYSSNSRGHLVTPSDGADQATRYNMVICVTAGNFVFTLLDPITGVETTDITLAMTAGMQLPVTPKKIKVASTGTYLGVITT